MCLCERQCICGSACYSNCDDFLSIVGMPQMVPLRITRVGCQAPMPTRCGRRTVAHQRSGKAGRGCSVAQAQGCHGNLSLGASVHFQSKDDCCLKWWILFFGQGKNQDAVMIRVPLSIPYVLLGCASQLICGYYMLINYRYPDVPS